MTPLAFVVLVATLLSIWALVEKWPDKTTVALVLTDIVLLAWVFGWGTPR